MAEQSRTSGPFHHRDCPTARGAICCKTSIVGVASCLLISGWQDSQCSDPVSDKKLPTWMVFCSSIGLLVAYTRNVSAVRIDPRWSDVQRRSTGGAPLQIGWNVSLGCYFANGRASSRNAWCPEGQWPRRKISIRIAVRFRSENTPVYCREWPNFLRVWSQHWSMLPWPPVWPLIT